ncbi:MAG: class II aldolase/adducin family protein [Geminicoccaceae bacterium]|nr:class II aldolase/adducin family protein [Geminicoccaceae bacterium]
MPATKYGSLRKEIIETCLKMNALGINQGKSGNVSARVEEGILITPSGVAYERMQPADIALLHRDGSYEGPRLPSTEWRFHFDTMRAREDCGAIVHTHAAACMTLACLHMDIPSFHYMVAVAGGYDIRCAGYARFGTQELSDNVLAALEGRTACLMANHGMLALGADLDKALGLAVEVEHLANVYWRCLQVTRPAMLTRQQMDEVLARIGSYGKQPEDLAPGEALAFEPPPRRG